MRNRKLTRIREYDYSQNGFYFVTVCVNNRVEWFGNIENGKMILNEYGNIVQQCWDDLPNHYANIRLCDFVIMPNHVHGIIAINNVGNGLKPFPTTKHGLTEFVRALKTFSSRKINKRTNNGIKFHWQKSFHDHIIRNESSLIRIREYIHNNPLQWDDDVENPSNARKAYHLSEEIGVGVK